MDWMQVFTIITTIIGSAFALHAFLRGDIKEFKQEIKEDMMALEDRFQRRMDMLEVEMRDDRRANEERIRHIDEKWERLFERLLIQDKARAS